MNIAGSIAFHAGKAMVGGAVHAANNLIQEHEQERKKNEKKMVLVVILVTVVIQMVIHLNHYILGLLIFFLH